MKKIVAALFFLIFSQSVVLAAEAKPQECDPLTLSVRLWELVETNELTEEEAVQAFNTHVEEQCKPVEEPKKE